MKNFIILFIALLFLNSCKKDSEQVSIDILNGNIEIEVNKLIRIDYKATGPNIDSVALFINGISYVHQALTEGYFQFYVPEVGYYYIKVVAYHSGGIPEESQTITLQTLYVHKPMIDMIVTREDGLESYFVGEGLKIQFFSKSHWFNFEDCKEIRVKINEGPTDFMLTPWLIRLDTTTVEEYNIELMFINQDDSYYLINKSIDLPINPWPSVRIDYKDTDYNPCNTAYLEQGSEALIHIHASDNTLVKKVELYCNQELIFEEEYSYDYYSEIIHIDTLSQLNYTFYARVYDSRGFMTQSEDFYVNFSPSISLNEEEGVSRQIKIENSPYVYLSTTQRRLLKVNTQEKKIEMSYQVPSSSHITEMVYDSENQVLIIGLFNGDIYYFDPNTESFDLVVEQYFPKLIHMTFDHSLRQLMLITDKKLYSLDLNNLDTLLYPHNCSYETEMEYDEENQLLYVSDIYSGKSSGIGQFMVEKNSLVLNQFHSIDSWYYRSFTIIPETKSILAQVHYDDYIFISTENLGQQQASIDRVWVEAYAQNSNTFIFQNTSRDNLFTTDLNGHFLEEVYLGFLEYKRADYIIPYGNGNQFILIIDQEFNSPEKILFFETPDL